MQKENKNVALVIGLGGTGFQTLENLKKKVYSTSFSNEELQCAQFDYIKFLHVDSDINMAENSNILNSNERIFPCGGSINDELLEKPELNWFDKRVLRWDHHYFPETRQECRLVLFSKTLLYPKFKKTLSDLLKACDEETKINVFFITSSDGVTGSGFIIDTAYILKIITEELGITDRTKTCALISLPGNREGVIKTVSEINYGKAMSYAFLKELHFLMSLPENGDTFEQKYPAIYFPIDTEVNSKEPPFDLCRFVSVSGEMYGKKEYSNLLIADYIYHFINGVDISCDTISSYVSREKLLEYKNSYYTVFDKAFTDKYLPASVHLYENVEKNWKDLPDIISWNI